MLNNTGTFVNTFTNHCYTSVVIFFLLQLIKFLDANQMPRPVTIRTNTLKTRRRNLAQVEYVLCL